MTPHGKQFFALPFAVIGAFFLTALGGIFVTSKFTNWTEPYVGPVAAASVVVITFWLAPERKALAGLITFLVGAAAAWSMLSDSTYPELHPRAYQPTLIPFGLTLAGGIASYVGCYFGWRDADKKRNVAPTATPATQSSGQK